LAVLALTYADIGPRCSIGFLMHRGWCISKQRRIPLSLHRLERLLRKPWVIGSITLPAEFFAAVISAIALAATVVSAWASYNALQVSRREQTANIFLQFQQDYNLVSARFPARLRDPDFRPARASDDYRRLEEYWIFSFAEWYATHDLGGGVYGNLWLGYYAALAQGALDIPALRYVLNDMRSRHGDYNGAFPAYFQELVRISQQTSDPLPSTP
jgi:hypothetical protein